MGLIEKIQNDCHFQDGRHSIIGLVQGTCGKNGPNPKQIATVFDLFCFMYYGVPSTTQKSPRDSEWWISNYQGSKVKVSQSRDENIKVGQ